jgi:ABC-2 type transport system permease protein
MWQVRNVNKTLLIFTHEFLRTIRRTGFIVLALALPVLGLLAIGVTSFVSKATPPQPEVMRIGYVDEAGGFGGFTTQGKTMLVRFDTEEAATQAIVNREIKEYFVIPADFISKGMIERFVTQREFQPYGNTQAAIQTFVTDNLLSGKVSPEVIARVQMPASLVTTTLTPQGTLAEQLGYGNLIVAGIFALLLLLSLIFTSTYVLQGLGEEKENRLMEILLSSVSTRQLVTGKVLGLGAAGLVQVAFWVVTFPLLLRLGSVSIGGILNGIHVPLAFWVVGLTYFILGYLLFAVLSASVAAVTSTVKEAQALAAMYTLFPVVPFWGFSLLLLFPNSPLWVVLSIFPFTAPTVVMLRLGLTGIPAWQLAASLTVMVFSVLGGLWLAGRLLRTYVLMYGKRPGLGEIVKSLRAG